MKLKWVTFVFLVLVAAALRLPAQQSDDGLKFFEDTKAKAELGDARAQNDLGFCYHEGRGVAQNYTEAIKWYHIAANQGNAESQFNLGTCYEHSQGVAQDYVEAAKWYRNAADQNLAGAQYNLGICYRDGKGVPQDLVEAVKWYRKAADQDNVSAQSELGVCYHDGKGVTKDYLEAVKWYRKAADHGVAVAQFNLANCYIEGQGVVKNYVETVNWYRKAAEQGFAAAQYNIGVCYANGEGVAKDIVEAAKYYRKAANQNYPEAQVNLGNAYFDGKGVPKDYVEAYKWYNLASAQGLEIAKEYLSLVEGRMTPEQIAEAQRRSSAFIPLSETHDLSSNVSSSPANPSFTGTGFFITDDGYLISNYHVVKGAAKVRLLTGAGLIDASVVKVDAANDLALLKAVGRFAPLPIAASRTVKLGGTVATVGFPDIGLQGFAPKLAKGEIASLAGAGDDPRYFQISLPVQPGNSGGALVDARGNVVGIVAAKLDASVALAATGSLPENVNYAVKSSLLLSFLESVPDVDAKLKDPNTKDEAFEDVVKAAQDAAVLVLVY